MKKSPNFQNKKYICELCDYICNKNSEYIRHLLTRKHIGNAAGNEKIANEFKCRFCSKIYKSNKGLWSHNKICTPTTLNKIYESNETIYENTLLDSSSNEFKILTNLVLEIVKNNSELQKQNNELQKQNQDFQKQVLDICKNKNNINNNTVISNNNNKTFNLQFFLNEQ